METETTKTFNHMNEYQRNWCIAKAKMDCAKEFQEKESGNPIEYEKFGRMFLAALDEFKVATAKLLTFARERVARDMANRPELQDVLKLYEADVVTYLNVDVLPNCWQSKLIDATMRTNFKEA